MGQDKKALSTDYEGGRESGRESRRGRRRDRPPEDYSDAETVQRSHYSQSSRTKAPSTQSTVKRFDNKGGPPLSKSALSRGFADPNTPRSVAPSSTAGIDIEGHKSATVVDDEVYDSDMRTGIRDGKLRAEAVEDFRRKMEQRQGSLNEEDRKKRISKYTQETLDRVASDRATAVPARSLSRVPTERTSASGATQDTRASRDTGSTRKSKPQTRAGSVDPYSRGSQNTRLRSGSTATYDRNPVQGGASFHYHSTMTSATMTSTGHSRSSSMISSTTMISSGNSGAAIHSQTHRNSTHNPSGDCYSGIADSRSSHLSGGHSRIEDLGSVTTASDASESTIKPLRRKKKLADDWPFGNSESGAKTLTPSEASRLGRSEASGSRYTGSTECAPEPVFEIREPRRSDPSVATSRRSRSTVGPPPSLNSYRGYRPPSTTSSHLNRLAGDKDLAVEDSRYPGERYQDSNPRSSFRGRDR
ncbi:hypothetical protein EAE96_000023 [Botrytis aclada]|nr:hypothetical protein EAE96_000023 [Botrytis aclada]